MSLSACDAFKLVNYLIIRFQLSPPFQMTLPPCTQYSTYLGTDKWTLISMEVRYQNYQLSLFIHYRKNMEKGSAGNP